MILRVNQYLNSNNIQLRTTNTKFWNEHTKEEKWNYWQVHRTQGESAPPPIMLTRASARRMARSLSSSRISRRAKRIVDPSFRGSSQAGKLCLAVEMLQHNSTRQTVWVRPREELQAPTQLQLSTLVSWAAGRNRSPLTTALQVFCHISRQSRAPSVDSTRPRPVIWRASPTLASSRLRRPHTHPFLPNTGLKALTTVRTTSSMPVTKQ